MTAREPQRPIDHVRPLPPAVLGRGADPMSDAEIAATYTCVPDTGYGIGMAGVAVELSDYRSELGSAA